ncbi:DUF433 domain-containing protein [Nocardioides sp. Bht2]|uniref:DUF433 domain-containing protein n=1 Tax=Nocardioides sp. Bht2 TaxID=3392297 RepID=UPI0039B3A505
MTQTVPGFERLTVEADKLGGQPCIRGYRFSAEQLLGLLAEGYSVAQIQIDYPFIEPADVTEVLRYAVMLAERDHYLPGRATA